MRKEIKEIQNNLHIKLHMMSFAKKLQIPCHNAR